MLVVTVGRIFLPSLCRWGNRLIGGEGCLHSWTQPLPSDPWHPSALGGGHAVPGEAQEQGSWCSMEMGAWRAGGPCELAPGSHPSVGSCSFPTPVHTHRHAHSQCLRSGAFDSLPCGLDLPVPFLLLPFFLCQPVTCAFPSGQEEMGLATEGGLASCPSRAQGHHSEQ